MKKTLSILTFLALTISFVGCGGSTNSNENDPTFTINPELSQTVEFNGYTFNVSPYWNTEYSENAITFNIDSENHFNIISFTSTDLTNLTDNSNIKSIKDYYYRIKEYDGEEDDERGKRSHTTTLFKNHNNIEFCKVHSTYSDRLMSLDYTFYSKETTFLRFEFSNINDYESYIPDIIESVKEAT